ncbi:hypothetical protein EKO27_g11513 [Xylaria grammica]|uniref:Uncharacterized protein n=1 Tax=Xylaria grammica TaxID=363999 RepID=A0A439CN38_9PEZI|nr:hypothetical protein EKO27_g11513 [Xylaria grammica]
MAAYGPGPIAAQTKPPTRTISSYTPAPSSSHTAETHRVAQPYQAQHVEGGPSSEPRPYLVDTTGLSTSHLPPPPTRYSGTDQPPPVHPLTQKATPSLPPRLPPRSGDSTLNPTLVSGQAASQSYLNQGAIDRLGASGISVPELGIGKGRTPPTPPAGAQPSPPLIGSPAQDLGYAQVDKLQGRFARMGTSSFQASPTGTAVDGTQQRSTKQMPSVLGKKKPPPPPTSKKSGLSGTRESADTPPPVPLATRPRFD